jgi:hypothetical protein
MTRLRTRAWRQFLLLLLLALFGCGADLSVSLPNDHLLVVANTNDVAIVSRREFGVVVKHSVGRLDTDGDYVFGEIVDPDTRLFTEYFVLDTRTSGAAYYPGQAAWEAALAEAGVSEIDLRGPSAFFNVRDHMWWRFALVVCAVLIAVSSAWFAKTWVSKRRTLSH